MLKNIKTYDPLSDYNKVIKKLNNNGVRPTKQRMVLAKHLFSRLMGSGTFSINSLHAVSPFARY